MGSGFTFRTLRLSGERVLGLGLRVWGFGFRVSGFGLGLWVLEFLGFGFGVCCGFWV